MTHTPGPWRSFHDDESHDIMAADGAHIARMEPLNAVEPEREELANADLIAAAPDMLAALKLCDTFLSAQRGLSPKGIRVFGAVRAAIRKAEGREAT